MKFCDHLDLVELRKLSQQALADAIGVTRQTVFAIEKNRYSPSLETAFKIAEVFNVPLDVVFKFREEG